VLLNEFDFGRTQGRASSKFGDAPIVLNQTVKFLASNRIYHQSPPNIALTAYNLQQVFFKSGLYKYRPLLHVKAILMAYREREFRTRETATGGVPPPSTIQELFVCLGAENGAYKSVTAASGRLTAIAAGSAVVISP
jgi:hypothetical protein